MAKSWQNIKHRCMNNNKMVIFVLYAAATLNWCVYNWVLPLFSRSHCVQIRLTKNDLNFDHTVSVYRV